jgi:hypothetical protein
MRQKPYLAPVLIMIVGLGLFNSIARSPSFGAYRTFDIVSLVLVGVCFGYAAASLAGIKRGLADRR